MLEWQDKTNREWQLFDMVGSKRAARSLNAAMRRGTKAVYRVYKKSLSLCGDNDIVREMWTVYSGEIQPIQKKYEDVGACDTEINWIVDGWFEKIKEDLISAMTFR